MDKSPVLQCLALCQQLIQIPSITPEDKNCQEKIRSLLESSGFICQDFPAGKVKNLWARFGDAEPLLVFAGHTDVVPAGDETRWLSPPFVPTITDQKLYGRGSADMKGALAAMITAACHFVKSNIFKGSIAFLITSGEEGDDFFDGTPYVLKQLQKQNITFDYCIVGEPTCEQRLGDTIKVGRRGSLTGFLKVQGKQGHVAYPHQAHNAIHLGSKIIYLLQQQNWDDGDDFFPKTSWQATYFNAGVAGNVIPGEADLQFNFRYSPHYSAQQLQARVNELLDEMNIHYELKWRLNGEPYRSEIGELVNITKNIIKETTDIEPQLSTSGGTSDARFIAPYCREIIEFGAINESIHQINEWIGVNDLYQLYDIYFKILKKLFLNAS